MTEITELPGEQPPRGRRTWPVALGVVALAVAFGAGLATGRATAPKTTAAASAESAPATTEAAPAADGATGSTTGLTGLTGELIPVPAGGTPRTVSGAGADGSLTLSQYLKLLYPTSSTEGPLLQERGFTGAATRWMDTASGQEVSIYLIGFSSETGAQSYALALGKAHEAVPANAGQTKFSVDALTDGVGYQTAKLDQYGNTDSYVYGAANDVTIIVHCYTPAKLDQAGLLALVDQQAARLG